MGNIRIIMAFLAGTVVLMTALHRQGAVLTTPQSPYGIVSLELSSNPSKVGEIVSTWEAAGTTDVARKNIRMDFLFIPFYALFLYMLCGSLACLRPSKPDRVGAGIAFGCLLAGLLDALENALMLISLKGNPPAAVTWATFVFAAAKFTLVCLAVLYILLAGTRLSLSKKR